MPLMTSNQSPTTDRLRSSASGFSLAALGRIVAEVWCRGHVQSGFGEFFVSLTGLVLLAIFEQIYWPFVRRRLNTARPRELSV
jgi:hypothetical protein